MYSIFKELRKGRQAGPDQKATECQATESSFLWHTSEEHSMFPFFTETLVWALVRMEQEGVGRRVKNFGSVNI